MPKHPFILGSFVTSCTANVIRFPKKGESISASSFILEAGGKGFNVMLALQHLGIEFEAVVAVGDDLAGRLAPSLFAEFGLATHYIVEKIGQTGGGICFSDDAGETSLAIYNGANDRLSALDIEERREQISNALLVASPFEVGNEPIIATFQIARAAGVCTLLNPSPYRPITKEILDLTDILVVNETEAEAILEDFADISFSGADQSWAALKIAHIIVTLGAEGANYYENGVFSFHLPARPAKAIDTLGAGDAFTAGLIAGLSHGLALREAMKIGHECAGVTVEIAGTSRAFAALSPLTIAQMPR